jgi:hypothetical protein
MPVVEVDDVRPVLKRTNPGGSRYTEERKLVGVRRKRPVIIFPVVDAPGTLRLEQLVMQNDVLHATSAGDLPDLDVVLCSAKRHGDRRRSYGTGQSVQRPIGRCRNLHPPAFAGQSHGQVAHDVSDATDFATGEGAVLRGEKQDRVHIEDCFPNA